MDSKDYYNMLNIDRNATKDDIKKAYRKLAMEFHPDVNKDKDAEGKFAALGEAYSVLSDSQKRFVYNQTGATNFSGSNNLHGYPFQGGRGKGGCRGMGMGMGKCSGLGAALRRRPRRTQKPSPTSVISE